MAIEGYPLSVPAAPADRRDASPAGDGLDSRHTFPSPGTVTPGRVAGVRWWPLPADPGERRARAIRDGLIIAGWMTACFVFFVVVPVGQSLGYDAFSYWSIELDALYARTVDNNFALGAFRYSPPVAFLFAPAGVLPWWAFFGLYLALMLAIVAWLGGRWTLALLALPPVALELYHGNVHLLMAAAVALGFRHPWAWSFLFLTKITPFVGITWFAVRREWRALAMALGATGLVTGVSLALTPALWAEWVAALVSNLDEPQPYSVPPPFVVRLPLAIALVAWGARTDRPWTVAVGAALALPIIWIHGLVVALAAVPLLRQRARHDATAGLDGRPSGGRAKWLALLRPERSLAWREAARARDLAAYLALAVGLAVAGWLLVGGPLRQLLVEASLALIPFMR